MVFAAAIPTLLGMVFAIWIAAPKFVAATNLDLMSERIQLARALDALVHEQQKERGATAVFLSANGERFQSELANQRRATDARMSEAVSEIEKEAGRSDAPEFVELLDGIMETIC